MVCSPPAQRPCPTAACSLSPRASVQTTTTARERRHPPQSPSSRPPRTANTGVGQQICKGVLKVEYISSLDEPAGIVSEYLCGYYAQVLYTFIYPRIVPVLLYPGIVPEYFTRYCTRVSTRVWYPSIEYFIIVPGYLLGYKGKILDMRVSTEALPPVIVQGNGIRASSIVPLFPGASTYLRRSLLAPGLPPMHATNGQTQLR